MDNPDTFSVSEGNLTDRLTSCADTAVKCFGSPRNGLRHDEEQVWTFSATFHLNRCPFQVGIFNRLHLIERGSTQFVFIVLLLCVNVFKLLIVTCRRNRG